MKLVTEPVDAIDLKTTPIHLGLGSRAMPVDGFAWQPDVLEAYITEVADDGADGRMVTIFDVDGPATHWEQHPAGDEVVICLAGRVTLTREQDGRPGPVELGPGQAAINPAGVWHTFDAQGPARILTITPGIGTEHRPR